MSTHTIATIVIVVFGTIIILSVLLGFGIIDFRTPWKRK